MNLVKNVHKELLAKTSTDSSGNKVGGISVFAHCLIVGIVCREFVKYLPEHFVNKFNLSDFPLWCARHDIGKVSPGFQYRINCAIVGNAEDANITSKYVMRHENVSASYLYNRYMEDLERAECVLSMIEWHHGGDRTERDSSGRSLFSWDSFGHSAYGEGEWDLHRDEVDDALVSVFGSGMSFIDTWSKLKKGSGRVSVLDSEVKYMMGLLSVCDWIGSDDSSAFKASDFMGDDLDIDLISDYANAAINRFGLNFRNITRDLSFEDLFKFPAYSIQSSFPKMVDDYGLYIVEAPMGYGKTEAALAGAYHAMSLGLVNGVYFALPTQMTSNSMFSRYKEFVGRICDFELSDIRLVHSKALYASSENSGMRSWFHGNKRGTLSQFGLGTMDQALMGVISSMKHFYIRSYGLSHKAIIIDEVHSYDVYTGTLVRELIDELIELKCVVIVLSATLTAANRGLLSGSTDYINRYPLVTKSVGDDVTYYFSRDVIESRRYRMRMHSLAIGDENFIESRLPVLDETLERIERGELVLWIENTVRDSQSVYNWFINHISESDIGLLNSWFTNKDRELNESKWVSLYGKGGKRDRGLLLISTQVCEQSIDIDADFLVTALCPTDMLLQRLGREHRHFKLFKRTYIPECVILCPSALDRFESDARGGNLVWTYRRVIGSSAWVYSPYLLRRTYAVWKDVSVVELPKDIRTLLEKTYDESYIGDHIDSELKRHDADRYRRDKRDALNTLSGGLGSTNDDNDFSMIDDLDNVAVNATRKIVIPSREVYLVKSIDGDTVTTFYGEEVTLSDRMPMSCKVSLNDCGIKIRNTHIERFSRAFVTKTFGKIDYMFCILNNGVAVGGSNQLVPNIQYSSQNGLVIRFDD